VTGHIPQNSFFDQFSATLDQYMIDQARQDGRVARDEHQ
jgi:hypothetical protein